MFTDLGLILGSIFVTYVLVWLIHKFKLSKEYAEVERLKQDINNDFQKLRMEMEVYKQNIQLKINDIIASN